MIVCGLDIGSTNLKVVLADEAGRTLWLKSVPAPHLNDGLGVTTDATVLMELLEDLVIEGWREVGVAEPLVAISSAGRQVDVDAPASRGRDWHRQALDRTCRLSGSAVVRPAFHERDFGRAHRLL